MNTTVGELLETVFSVGSDMRIYNKRRYNVSYKRLKLGGGQVYDCSND
jgi:hypothetical protein